MPTQHIFESGLLLSSQSNLSDLATSTCPRQKKDLTLKTPINSGLSPQTLLSSLDRLSIIIMALFLKFLFIFSLNFLFTTSFSHNPILPKAAIIPVTKDDSTLQYIAQVFIGENNSPVKLVLDLNSPLVWIVNQSEVNSHQPIRSCSIQCSMTKSTSCFSNSTICTLLTENTISKMSTCGQLSEGRIGLAFWDGTNSGSIAKSSSEFVFSCAPNLLLKGLANGAKGMLGLGNSRIALPSQLSSKFGFFERKFSISLSKSQGAVFIGGSPLENEMVYTPLVSNKNGYFINVNSIRISGKKVYFSRESVKISTTVAYTTMESKLYRTFVEAYISAANEMNMSLVPRVAPFEVCFSSKEMKNVPSVDFFLQSEMVKWRFYGRNMMVPIGYDVMCLAFIDGGLNPKDSIVIGGYMLEDYLLEFNLGNSMFGFSPSSDFKAFALV